MIAQDTASRTWRTARDMYTQLPSGLDANQPHVYTISFGVHTDQDVLQYVCARTNGRFYSITDNYRDLFGFYQQIAFEF